MSKRLINLYAEDEQIELAKARGINLSQLFRNALKAELNLQDDGDQRSKDDIIRELKTKISKLSSTLEDKNQEIEKLKRERFWAHTDVADVA